MQVTESERRFLHELHAIKRDPLGKRIIHFFVSLAPQSGDLTRKTESAALFVKKAFAKSPYCEIFTVSNGDMLVTYSHISVSEVLQACSKVEKLFCEDMVPTTRNSYNEYAFFKVLDAAKDLDKVFGVVKGIIAQRQPAQAAALNKRPMGPENLAYLSDKLRNADLRHCIFNQPVYYIAEKVPSIEFLEFYVSVQQLEDHFLPDFSLTGNPWLFHALTEDFDRATLRTLTHEIAEYRHKSFSLNIALNTVLSRAFIDFYDKLPTRLAGRIVLEIHKTDLVQNYSLMRDVKSLAEEKGLRLCIDGMDWRDFDILNMGRLKPHFLKVPWHNDLLAAQHEDLARFVDAIRSHDSTEIIMTRCDNPKAFPLAKTMGIRYVQGKLADRFFKTGMAL